MKFLRISLLLFMSFILFLMVACPAFHHTNRLKLAVRHYNDAPSPGTQREIEEANRLDNKDMFFLELVMAGVFGLSIYAFTRSRRIVTWVVGPQR